MANTEAAWLETLVRKHASERSVARVLNVKSDKALGPGENYTSDIVRVNMRVALGSGIITEKRLIVKVKTAKAGAILDKYNIYKNEIEMYADVFPQFELLMSECGDVADFLWAEYYGSTENQIIFDDLKVKGFILADRQEGLNFEHALMTVTNLGWFHAMSVVALKRGRISVAHLPPYLMARNEPFTNKFFKSGVEALANTISADWEPKWAGTADKLRATMETIGERLQELSRADDAKFKVLNHGDCWVNNMLFKYHPASKRPAALKFVDYQLVHYNSYAWDLNYFVYSSVKPSVRREHMSELLDAYHRVLMTTMESYDCRQDDAPSIGDVSAEMERLLFSGLMVSCTLTPIMMADPEHAMDIEAMSDDSSTGVHNTGMYLNPNYKDVIQEDLEHFINMGVL